MIQNARVALVQEDSIVITLGTTDRVAVGNTFGVLSKVEGIHDPQNHEFLGQVNIYKDRYVVTQAAARFSVCVKYQDREALYPTHEQVEVGDVAIFIGVRNAG